MYYDVLRGMLYLILCCVFMVTPYYLIYKRNNPDNNVETINFKVGETYIKKDYFYDEENPFDVEKCDTIKIVDIKKGYILIETQEGYEHSYSVEMLSRAIKNKLK